MDKMLTSVRKISIASALVALIWSLGSAAIAADMSTTNIDEIPGIVSGERGQPTVVVVFSSRCSLSQNLWPHFVEFANQYRGKNVSFLVFSTDKNQNNATDFVSRYNVPFRCYWIEPYSPGTLAASMRTLGIQVGNRFTLPLVVVRDSNGRVVGQWQGLQSVLPIINSLRSIIAI